jgi:putative copper export protein/methionine-rich copper-binding protein CopC
MAGRSRKPGRGTSHSYRSLFSIIVLALLCLGTVRPALAHGYLLRAIPEDYAVLERAPARLQYWFSEGLEPAFSSLNVRDQAGNIIASGGISPDNDSLLSVRLPRDLPDGAYIADMRLAFASDGHVVAQSRVFFVGESVGGISGQAATTQANPLEVIWRTLTLSATILLFGTYTLYAGVLIPSWGSSDFRVGLLPPRLMRRLSWIIAGGLVAAFLGNILALLQQSMVFFNADLGQVISQQLWSAVRTGTRFGDLWNARIGLLIIVAGASSLSLYFRDEQPETVRPFWTASAWAMALMMATLSAGSHAAGSLLLPWVGIIMDWLHLLAVGFWAGGLAALVLVISPALATLNGEPRRLALLAVLRHFSRVAVACLAIVISTGIYSASNWIYAPSDLTATPYGGALVIKVILVASLLLVGSGNFIALNPGRYDRWTSRIAFFLKRLPTFIPTMRLEVIAVLAVLVSVGFLSATPVPTPAFVQEAVLAPSATQTVGDFSVTMTLTPGGPGANTYDVLITRDGLPLDGLDVRLQVANPARDKRGAWLAGEDSESGLYVAAGAEIDQAGDWWTLVDITAPDGTTQRAAFSWTISPDAAIQQSRNPDVLNLLALAGVIGAISWVGYPSARRGYQRLDLRPAVVTAAVGATLATLFLSVMGFAVIQSTQEQYNAVLNPPPKVVNIALPDAASLERGHALYEQACSRWVGVPDLKDLLVPRTRDDMLFAAVRDGWRGLPACASLDDAQRWDVVNYIRTMG